MIAGLLCFITGVFVGIAIAKFIGSDDEGSDTEDPCP